MVLSPSMGSAGVTPSTVSREKLPAGSVVTTDYIKDTTGVFIDSQSKAKAGMKKFFEETGVQPYLYVVESLNGNRDPSDAEVDKEMNRIYDETFQDEAHILIYYMHRPDYDDRAHILSGTKAELVVDSEARDIILDYFEAYYFDESLNNSEYVSKVFDKAQERIMQVTKPFWVMPAIIIGSGFVILIIFKFWKKKKAQDNREAEQTERILSTPIEKIGDTDPELEELKDKYDDE